MKIPVPVKFLVPASLLFCVPASADECDSFHKELAQVSVPAEYTKIVKNVVYANVGMTFFVEKNFAIGNYEVSQEEYEFIMGSNPSQDINRNKPVENVSWHDAMLFCEKLTKYAREEGLITDLQTFRLPTSEEWEYACTMGHYIQICCPKDVAWISENANGKTHTNKDSALQNKKNLQRLHALQHARERFRMVLDAGGNGKIARFSRRELFGIWRSRLRSLRHSRRRSEPQIAHARLPALYHFAGFNGRIKFRSRESFFRLRN